MLQNRIEGFSLLIGLAKMLLAPIWSILLLIGIVELTGLMNYQQVNALVYLFGVIAAFAIGLNFRFRPRSGGPARQHWISAVRQSNKDVLILALVVFAIIYATKDKAISRQFVAFYLMFTWIYLILLNRFLPLLFGDLFFNNKDHVRTLFIGSPEHVGKLEHWIENQRQYGLISQGLVVFQKDDMGKTIGKIPTVGTIEELAQLIDQFNIQQIVLLDSRNNRSFVQYIVDHSQDFGCRLLVHNPWEHYFAQPLTFVQEGNHSFFTLQSEPLQNPVNRIIKRFLDIGMALPVCFFLFPPLALFVKISQMIQAPGPLFHQQMRNGIEKNPFSILKFRTMYIQPKMDEGKQAEKDDPRIYPVGSFLRKSSLDEIPQFWNVLRGSMSVVGPRPHLIQHDELFAKQVNIYKHRHHAKPGITGMAQHLGFRGEIKSAEDIDRRIELDLQYIYSWSIWLDLGIIIKTAWQIFFPPGKAY